MNWIERLNRVTGRIVLGEATIEARSWAYSQHLADNVPHRHTYFEVCYVDGWGQGLYRVEGVPYSLVPGTLFFARPGVLHQIVNTVQPWMELYWVCFQWTAGGTRAGGADSLFDRFARSSVLVHADTSGTTRSLWHSLRLAAESASNAPEFAFGMETQLRALMAALLIAIAQAGCDSATTADRNGNAPSDVRIRQAVRYVHDHLDRPLSVSEVADALGVSERQLARLFLRFVGVSPALYITRARMDRAAALLLRTDDPIKQIAALLGYEDIHHFTRVFTRTLGCPPGRFRREGGGPKLHSASPETVGQLVW
ncbi:MAG: AraC family transcriptional regulator [Capsulimonadales bacterium]|nr:AraC family transcriptional regulator [Capsulimonadales bacterium]